MSDLQAFEVLAIQPRDIYVILSISAANIEHLLDFLDKCTIEYDKEKETELHAAVSYVTNDFFKQLNQLSEDLKQGDK